MLRNLDGTCINLCFQNIEIDEVHLVEQIETDFKELIKITCCEGDCMTSKS